METFIQILTIPHLGIGNKNKCKVSFLTVGHIDLCSMKMKCLKWVINYRYDPFAKKIIKNNNNKKNLSI